MDKNTTFYELYRPRQLSHIIGQESVVRTIKKSCEKDFFHHSYLLAGNFGTGKTSLARILASIFNCEKRQVGSFQVCSDNFCDSCASIRNGNCIDVHELDGASNTKVENTRSIIESSRYSPQNFKKKIFIIDECHRLSNAAMTSLLKTLEEPSPSSVFILCTTEIDKVPKEIISRCQKLIFKPVSLSIISSYLSKLFIKKNIDVSQEICDSIAISSRGSVRDAMELAQEIFIMSNDGKVTDQNLSDIIGMPGRNHLYKIIESISQDDLIGAFDVLEDLLISDSDSRSLCYELSSLFRSIMISKISKNYINNLTKTEKDFIISIEDKFDISKLSSILSDFENAERGFNININNKWVLESLIINIIDKLK